MADEEHIIVSPLVQAMLEKLTTSDLLLEFGSEWKVEKEVEDLSEPLENIKAMLGCLEMFQIRDPLLKLHLNKLRDLAYYVDDVLDEFIYEVRRRRLLENQKKVSEHFSFSLNDSNQVLYQDDIALVINDLKEKLVQTENNLKSSYLVWSSQEMKTTSIQLLQHTMQKSGSLIVESHVVGREKDVNFMKKILLGSNYQKELVIVLVGMGGLGKTTLAQLVYNDPDVENYFDMKAWVCVSDDFDIERITEAILESATGKPCNLKTREALQRQLKKEVGGKKFLLVLDDVWNEDQASWDALRVPFRFAGKKSGIIITTRSTTVSSIVNPIYHHDLQSLSDEDCWSLIKSRASLDEHSNSFSKLDAIGRKIAEKCKGSPLAANTLGSLLHSISDENEWEDILQSNQWNNIRSILILSYHYLPPHLKQCFAYCSLFPKDYEFDKEKLIRLWIAEGFIPSRQVDIMEDIGSQYFDDLLARSFFQKCSTTMDSFFVMHDLIHDLAESVSGNQCVRIDKSSQKCSTALSKEVRHVSIFTGEIADPVADVFSARCKSLSTFVSKWVPQAGFFQELRRLRVLDLSNNGIKALPDFIGELKHLRYVDISGNNIKVLPESMCKLYNLQTLNVSKCRELEKLPMNTRNLFNLRHLMTSYKVVTPLDIGRLTCLKTLSIFHVSQNDGCRIGQLKELRQLEGKLMIDRLENVVNVEDASEANLKNKPKLRQLELKWRETRPENSDGNITVLEALQPHTELKDLVIEKYGGSRFPNWMVIDLFDYNKLLSIELKDCTRCEFPPPLGQLPLLQSLSISRMLNVKQLGHEFYGGNEKRFQLLQTLRLKHMDNLRKWVGGEEGEFPCLKKLYILKCQNLRELPPSLPNVKELEIKDCKQLTTLPRIPSISELHLEGCHVEILSLVDQNLTCLKNLSIKYFPSLTSLPQGFSTLSSLKELRVCECRNLRRLPVDGFPTGLKFLSMISINNDLKRRCEEGKKDWPKIAYIPKRKIR